MSRHEVLAGSSFIKQPDAIGEKILDPVDPLLKVAQVFVELQELGGLDALLKQPLHITEADTTQSQE